MRRITGKIGLRFFKLIFLLIKTELHIIFLNTNGITKFKNQKSVKFGKGLLYLVALVFFVLFILNTMYVKLLLKECIFLIHLLYKATI